MNTVKSFVRQFVATVSGDDATVKAEKAFRQADSALRTHIAVLKGDVVPKEDAVISAKEELSIARINNCDPITNRDLYVRNLLQGRNNVTLAQEALDLHISKIEFLELELLTLSAEVEG